MERHPKVWQRQVIKQLNIEFLKTLLSALLTSWGNNLIRIVLTNVRLP